MAHGFDTICTHEGEDPARWSGAVAPPLFQNSLFAAPDVESFFRRGELHPGTYDYTRVRNPTTDILEAKIAALERTEAARCFGSGMAAVAAAVLHCVRTGEHVVAVDTVYGPTREFLSQYLARFDIAVSYVPGIDPEDFARAARPETRLFFLESPSSLVFRLQDLSAVAAIARERDITTVIDNSWATPYYQNPTEFGIDLVLHSATKYLGGHSDLVAGVVAGPRRLMDGLIQDEGTLLGGILDPFAAWLMLRGLRTLSIRLERHERNALAVAGFLAAHPRVACVHYPGLASHPQQDLVRRQLRGSSGLLSFELEDGSREGIARILDRLKLFALAVSWGGYESLAIPLKFRSADGPGRWGARLHIGLETEADLLTDLEQALEP